MVSHALGCRSMRGEHSDAAKKLCDTYNLHTTVDRYGSINKWFAVALADGSSDGILYDNKDDCVRHQHHNESFYAYICIRPSSMNVCEAETYLHVQRRLYDAGLRVTDPRDMKQNPTLIKRATVEDMRSLVHAVEHKSRAQNLNYGGKS